VAVSCLRSHATPPTFLIWNNSCDLVYQIPTRTYRGLTAVGFGHRWFWYTSHVTTMFTCTYHQPRPVRSQKALHHVETCVGLAITTRFGIVCLRVGHTAKCAKTAEYIELRLEDGRLACSPRNNEVNGAYTGATWRILINDRARRQSGLVLPFTVW